MIISTRQTQEVRSKLLRLGVSQVSGGSRTSVGGYTEDERSHDTEQFDISDQRSLDEVVCWLDENKRYRNFLFSKICFKNLLKKSKKYLQYFTEGDNLMVNISA